MHLTEFSEINPAQGKNNSKIEHFKGSYVVVQSKLGFYNLSDKSASFFGGQSLNLPMAHL